MIRCAVLAALCIAATARAAIDDRVPGSTVPEVRQRQDRIVVRLVPQASARLGALRAAGGARRTGLAPLDRAADRLGVRRFLPEFGARSASPLADFWFADLPPGADPAEVAANLAALADVAEAHPIDIVPVTAVPNDSLWSVSWHLFQPSRRDVHGPEAWDVTTGDTSIVLAVLDTGVMTDHPDLRGQFWTNVAERDGLPGVDDDGNGYVDDVRGWDFIALATDADVPPFEDWRDEDNDPNDFAGHGTAVTGVAAGHANNGIGVAGMAWDIRVMPLRVGWATTFFALGVIDLSDAARAIEYAVDNGASVISCSFSTTAAGDLLAAVNAAIAAGVTVVFSSGNNGTQAAAAQLPGVISVAATQPNDVVAVFSNLHPTVALSAPGLSLPTTFIAHAGGDSAADRQPAYTTGASGTSFSAPLVAATAALVQSQRAALGLPPLAPIDMKTLIMETADAIDPLNTGSSNYGTGRLNAARALSMRRRSFRVRAAGASVGPAIVIPALRGETRIGFAMDTGELLFVGGASRDTLARIALPSTPVGAMSAADVGTGIGTVIWVPCEDLQIHAYDLLGRPLPGWPVPATGVNGSGWPTPALGDLDGDGRVEVVWGGNDGRVHAWHVDGQAVDGFPRVVGAPGPNPIVALADLDGVPGLEVVVAAASGTVIALDMHGAALPGWPQQLPLPASDVIVADIGGAPGPEVIAAGGSVIAAWRASGALAFSRTLPVYFGAGLAAADLNGDGIRELVAAMLDRVTVLDGAGLPLAGWPRPADALITGPPVIGGVTKLTPVGLLMGCDDGIGGSRLRGFTSTAFRLARYPLPGGAGPFVVLTELDGDDATEIVTGSGSDGSLWIYDAGEGTWRVPGWPAPGGNAARTRSPEGAPPLSPFDDVAPEPVADLLAERASPTRVTLRWTGVTDEGPSGLPVRYEIAASDRPFTPDEFDGAPWRTEVAAVDGTIEAELDDLPAGIDYWFAVRSNDASGNVSPVSNLAVLVPSAPQLAHGVRLTPLGNPARPPVSFAWLAAGEVADANRSVRIYDLGGRLRARLPVAPGFEGVVSWDGRDLQGRAVAPGLYFARFEAPSHASNARFALVR